MYNSNLPAVISSNRSGSPSNMVQASKANTTGPVVRRREEFADDRNIPIRYAENSPERFQIRRKDSFFNSLRVIYDLKEWVSCLVMGTNRRRPKKKVVFEDKKSVASFYFARGSRDSQSITGERLSSFAEYASINVAKSSNQIKKSNVGNGSSTQFRKSRKKRPAPLPPIPEKNFHSLKNNYLRNEVISENRNGITTKPSKSAGVISQSVHIKRKHKKRKAPSPPLGESSSILSGIGSVLSLIEHAKVSQDNLKRTQKDHRPKNKQKNEKVPKYPANTASKMNKKRFIPRNYNQNSATDSDSEHSGQVSSSLSSADESDEIVRYNKTKAKKGSVQRSSSFMKYAGTEDDVCVKISIQKTQTNVVTVEELPTSSTVHYTIEESSSSDLSEEEPEIVAPKAYAVKAQQESKFNSSDSSFDEVNDGSKRTIFEELQLKSPEKSSVKEFIQAFNMLADKGSTSYVKQISNGHTANFGITDQNISNYKNSTSKTSQSVPTKWEYQNNNNKINNFSYSANQILLPIEEESLNELPEPGSSGIISKSSKGRSKASMENGSLDLNQNKASKKNFKVEENLHGKSLGKKLPAKLEKKKSSQASAVALTSLLSSGTNDISEGDTTDSLKSSQQLDRPIMVGLHIENKSSHRGPLPLLVTPSMSLRKLKKQVESEYSFPRLQQCWIFGESFAVQDDASLASYGVTKPGCSVLLYVMSKESLPSRYKQNSAGRINAKLHMKTPKEVENGLLDDKKKGDIEHFYPKDSRKEEEANQLKTLSQNKKSEFHKAWEADFEKKNDYRTLVALDDVDLVSNVESFECPICMMNVANGEGVILQDCLHSFCKECLAGSIQYSDTAQIKCPFRNDEYSCESHLQEREIKCLVTPEIYEKHLQRSMALAESQALDSFHCKTPDCPGWCLFEDNVNTFVCPVCKKTNCLTCAAIHEGRNCKQYQDFVAFSCDTNEEAKKTKEYLQNMVQSGEAMECPQCQVILMKKWGCDWLKCSMCHTEVCWVTKGPRWGPGGKGDTSGGCKCMVNGVRCHPKCSYCH
ncbi:uncharacterized protein [Parasteatoda tepidariorum]|nr:uncharacterized protein LOC107450011 isoform X2 [Parasteatoda tepidariorum]